MIDYAKGKIYKVVNSVNEIIYIGSTCQTLSSRMAGHRSSARTRPEGALHHAMYEIGIDKFRIILIEDHPCLNKFQLEAREYKHMVELKFTGTALYNLMIGGKLSLPRSEETRQKLREANRGRVISEETRQKLREANRGRVISEETRQKHRGAANSQFNRGSVSFDKTRSCWRFTWVVDGKRQCKRFSVKKYGTESARGLALAFRDETYPEEPEDDSEFIRELRQQLNQ